MAYRYFSAAARKRAGTLPTAGSSWPQQSGSDFDVPVSSRTTPRAPGSTGLAVCRDAGVCASLGRPGRAATCTPRQPGVLRSSELKNHYHQNDDDEDTDNRSDNSSVHGQDLLSSLRGTRHVADVNIKGHFRCALGRWRNRCLKSLRPAVQRGAGTPATPFFYSSQGSGLPSATGATGMTTTGRG
jgi:hypothetical protein